METYSRHIISELSGCNSDYLEDTDKIREIIINAAISANAEVREVAVHKFSPQGVSGVVVIAESHLSIHTWPEVGYAAIDIFTCGTTTKPQEACKYLAEQLEADEIYQTEIKRGIPGQNGRFFHQKANESRSVGGVSQPR
ncbi:MAG: adenosylmethionine decarboxylase [Candidatus Eremiobacteraeota bacterium]|nr:adenosylmethionine decarboxylase [Candidatus Eremiobacteraeota bacterium]